MSQVIFRTLLLAVFAVWFGGFTFYAAVVVPQGTDVLGSSRTQGFVTQQVTHTLNMLGGIAIGLMTLEWIMAAKTRAAGRRRGLGTSIVVIGLLWVSLLAIHPLLDALLEPLSQEVKDAERFYGIHRIYLWNSAIQWLASWAWLLQIVHDWSYPKPVE